MSATLLLLVTTGLALGNAQSSMNATEVQDVFWLTVNVTYKFQTPPDLTTFSWCVARVVACQATAFRL